METTAGGSSGGLTLHAVGGDLFSYRSRPISSRLAATPKTSPLHSPIRLSTSFPSLSFSSPSGPTVAWSPFSPSVSPSSRSLCYLPCSLTHASHALASFSALVRLLATRILILAFLPFNLARLARLLLHVYRYTNGYSAQERFHDESDHPEYHRAAVVTDRQRANLREECAHRA